MTTATRSVELAARFVELHDRPGAFVIPNPWDVGTARVLHGLGFEALATTSAGLAFSLGRPDGEGAVTREEAIAHARTLVEAVPLPISADLENGFGDDPATVAETVRMAADAGLAGCSIEDATGRASPPIYEFTQAVERVAAAVEAARSAGRPFTLTARAENFLHGRPDLDDTFARLRAFEKAGADVLFAPGLADMAAIREVCAAMSRPVNVVMGLAGAAFSVGELAAAGVKRVSLGSSLSRAALGAFLRAAREIRETGTFGFAADAVPFSEIQSLMGGPGPS
jgi:2-methylisocitrate lyase-like PEP mutase family enzyme